MTHQVTKDTLLIEMQLYEDVVDEHPSSINWLNDTVSSCIQNKVLLCL
jgi:hypothetical protein